MVLWNNPGLKTLGSLDNIQSLQQRLEILINLKAIKEKAKRFRA